MADVEPIELRDQLTHLVLAHDYETGPLLLLAGPGTGKTYNLLHTIRERIALGYSLGDFFEATLTNAAAEDFLAEAHEIVSKNFNASSTLHYRAKGLLHNHAAALGINPGFTVIDDNCEALVHSDLRALLEMDPGGFKGELKQYRSRAAHGQLADDGFTRSYRRLQSFYSVLDWIDVVRLACQLLQDAEEVRARESAHFRLLLIDEYQDLNPADQRFVELLLNGRGALLAVGDDDQSIYSGRFADPTGITSFRERYPRATIRQLPVTSRLPSAVIEASQNLIARNVARHEKEKLISLPGTDERAMGGFVVSVNNKSDKAEGQFIHDAIRALLDKGVPPGEILVLCSCRALGLELVARVRELDRDDKIPIRNDLELAQALAPGAYLVQQLARLLANRHDNLAARVVIDEVAGRHTEEVFSLVAFAFRHDRSIWRALADDDCRAALPAVAPILTELERYMAALTPDLPHRENARQLVALCPYLSRVAQALEQEDHEGLEEHRQEEPVNREKAVRFTTLHSSKGLEGEFVFLPFLEDALGLPAADEEERRRLLYVALTRAKVGVIMSWAWSRRSERRYKCSGDGGDVTRRAPSSHIHETGVQASIVPLWQEGSSAATAIALLCRHAEAIYS